MNNYIVAFYSNMDGNITMQKVQSDSKLNALLDFYGAIPQKFEDEYEFLDWLWETQESVMNIIEV